MPPPAPTTDLDTLVAARDWRGMLAATSDQADPSAFLARAEALHRLGRAREALDIVRRIEAEQGTSYASRRVMAALLSRLGQHGEAIGAWTAAIMATPTGTPADELARMSIDRAEDQLLAGRPEDARTAALALSRRRPPTPAEMSILRRAIRNGADLDQFVALLSPLTARPGTPARASLTQLSLAFRDAGATELAVATARHRLLVGLEQTPFGSGARRDATTWKDEAEVALGDLLDDLHALGEEPFLVSGTLLGHVRDKGVIAHDKDLDLGLLTDTPVPTLAAGLASTGRFRLRPASAERLIQVEHVNGTVADIFIHWQEGGRILHGGRRGSWWNSAFDLVPAEIVGRPVRVPADADTYLGENYGPGWRTPDPLFETFLDTPNLVPPPADEMRWYYLTKLHDLHAAGRRAGMERVWRAFAADLRGDEMLRSAVEGALAAATDQ